MNSSRKQGNTTSSTADALAAISIEKQEKQQCAGFEPQHLHDSNQLEKKVYLVHCSNFAPNNGEIIAGMTLNGEVSIAEETIGLEGRKLLCSS